MSITANGTHVIFNDATTQTTAVVTDVPTGTYTTFMTSTAPSGWTKSIAYNDAALRVVSGTTGGNSAGTTAFSTVFGTSKTLDSTTVAAGSLPVHTHGSGHRIYWAGANRFTGNSGRCFIANNYTDYQGGGGSHNHTLSMDIQYADIIVASKD